jgi:hypothetical protein
VAQLLLFSDEPEIPSDDYDNRLGRPIQSLLGGNAGAGTGVDSEDPRVPDDDMQIDDEDEEGDGAGTAGTEGEGTCAGGGRVRVERFDGTLILRF